MPNPQKYGSQRQATRTQHAVDRAMGALRNWQEFAVIDEAAPKPKVIARISTLRFGLVIFIIAGILTLYIGHVHTSQDLLAELNTLNRENVRLHLQHNRLVANYNASIGPSVIHQRVPALGLQRGYEYAGLIQNTPQIQP